MNKLIKESQKLLWIPVVLVTFFVFLPVLKAGFLYWDDDIYIFNNPGIQGFSAENLKAIFGEYFYGLYNPFTNLSWAIEHSLVGFDPWLYHLDNLLLHLINTFLVFRLFLMIRRNFWWAGIVALLFGINTFHVESVAWATERKDVLYTLFYLLAMIQYLRYLDGMKFKRILFTFLLFFCSLMSKGMAVSLPLVMLGADYLYGRKLFSKKVILEKLPFLLFAGLFGLLNIKAQKAYYGDWDMVFSMGERIAFSAYSFIQYIIKTLIPYDLSVTFIHIQIKLPTIIGHT